MLTTRHSTIADLFKTADKLCGNMEPADDKQGP